MPNATDQPTDGSRRGTLLVLAFAAAVAAGLWLYLDRPEAPTPAERSEPAESATDAAPATGDTRAVESGTTDPEDTTQTVDAGATVQVEEPGTTEPESEAPADIAPTTVAGAAPRDGAPGTADSGADAPTDVARTTGAGETTPQEESGAADSGADAPTDVARTTGAGETTPQEESGAADSGADAPTDVARTTDAGETTPQEEPGAADSGADAPTDVARTTGAGETTPQEESGAADSGADAPTDVARTTGAGESTPQEESGAADSGAGAPTDVARTTGAGETTPQEESEAADSGADAPTDVARATDDDAATRPEVPETAATDAEAPTDIALTTDGGAATRGKAPSIPGTTGTARTAGVDSAGSTGAAHTADSASTGDARQPAAGDATSVPTEDDLVLAAAPEETVEREAIGAPPAAETTGATDILATVESAIERIESAIRERLATEADADTKLRVQVTYDDSEESDARAEDGSNVATRTTEADASSPAEDAPTQEPDVATGTDLTKSAVSDVEAGTELAKSTVSDVEVGTELAKSTVSDVEVGTELARSTVSDVEVGADLARSTVSDVEVGTDLARSTEPDVEVGTDLAGSTESDVEVGADLAGSTESDVGVGADLAGSTESDGAAPSDITRPADTALADAEARKFVETLTDTAPETIAVDRADHFVTQERVISLVPADTIESVSVDALARDETLSTDTPITVVREVEQIEPAVPEQLIAESGGDLDKPLRVRVTYDDSRDTTDRDGSGPMTVEEDAVEQITVREALERIRTEPKKPLSVIKTVRYFEVMTLRELLETGADTDTFLNVVTRPYQIESATLADLLQRHKDENPDSIFYLHTVQPTDEQGIWGIVHFGLIDNFARGMAIRHGKDIETYTVQIPRDADERLEDQSSSFLGRLIDRKTKDSYVYNFRDNRMGRNPDRIYPGQELVIINFEPEELTAIYRHFASG